MNEKRSTVQWAFLAVAVCLLSALIVWRLIPSRHQPILVGVVAPFGSTPGEGIRNGVAMAVEEINRAGGINGRELRVIEYDNAFSVEKAIAGYQKLAGDKAVAVIGFADDGVFGVMEQLKTFAVPVLCTGVGADKLTAMVAETPDRYGPFFRVMHSSSELGEVTSAFARDLLHEKVGLRKFAILVENAVWTSAIRDRWREVINGTEGMELVFDDSFSSETRDFLPLFTRIKQSGAEYVLDASSRVEATSYLKQWAATQGPSIGAIPTGAGTAKYYAEIGPAGTSVCSVNTIPSHINQATPKSEEWWKTYVSRYGDPEYTSAYSYDAVYILKGAIEAAGSTDPASVVKSLERIDYEGAAGRWVFGPGHHPRYGAGYRTIPIIQYAEPDPYGYHIIWPPDRAQRSFIHPPWAAKPSGG